MRPRHRGGFSGRHRDETITENDRRPAGHPQVRRRLRADRSATAAGAAEIPCVGRKAGGGPDPSPQPGRGRCTGHRRGRSDEHAARRRHRQTAPGRRQNQQRRPCLCDLHVRFHRPAQGGDDPPSWRGQLARLDARYVRGDARRRRVEEGAAHFRRFCLGAFPAADQRCQTGARGQRSPARSGLPRRTDVRNPRQYRAVRAFADAVVPGTTRPAGPQCAPPRDVRRRGAQQYAAIVVLQASDRGSMQFLRPDGMLDRCHPLALPSRRHARLRADRLRDRQHGTLHPRYQPRPGGRRGAGRIVHRRRLRRARLPQSP